MRLYKLIVNLQLLKKDLLRPHFEEARDKIYLNFDSITKNGILVCSEDPWAFMGAFLAGVTSKVPVFLGNPNWRENEWGQTFSQISPALIFGEIPNFYKSRKPLPSDLKVFAEYIMIPTGGFGGKIRFAIHSWESLHQSALATAKFLNKSKLNSLCLLPLYHISGLIQIVRSVSTDGEIVFKPLESFGENHEFEGFYLSLVPTQLERFMQNPTSIKLLKTFDTIFLGGAPASNTLLAKAREAAIRLSPTYGMTETGSMITAMDPELFLNGHTGVGHPLQHAKISISENGLINISANSLFSGYFPSKPTKQTSWKTNDEGSIDNEGCLTIVGRADRIIITGGEKVDPKELEDAILSTGLVSSVFITSVKDLDWGQRIVAIYVPSLIKAQDIASKIKEKLKETLANYKIPKDWIMVNQLPYDEKGKFTQASIEACLKSSRLLLEKLSK